MLLSHLLRRVTRYGTLRIIDAEGRTHEFRGGPGRTITARFHDKKLGRDLFLNPRRRLGEAYMDGGLTVEDGTLFDFLDFLAGNIEAAPKTWVTPLYNGFGHAFRVFQQYNPVRRAQANVHHHYDLSKTLYDLFLDSDRQYSCAYFTAPDQSIDQAQAQKKRHIAAKLLLKPGQRVLDIGCGWGGLALYLAKECGVEVTGLTLSTEQLAVARQRAASLGLADRVTFELLDYREAKGIYDRIVSVGMFEHVGVVHYSTFFRQVKGLLAKDGVALLHSIGRSDGPGSTHPWIRRYIFPGGYSPALSEVVPVAERTGFFITDIEVLRLHYAETLKAWRLRFLANRERVRQLYDDRFCRMWEFYLAASEIAFRHQGHIVFQMQLAKAVDTVPLTRDYITDWERSHAVPASSDRAVA
ncbi:MAG TPA: cyclopropane-fatty-acyl-phospholipid synthase family protein [Stellaceae bacterium]|nr:cyclopropane-fatty-acyl-phospholipid synthase family protein [Stellaceae bacterium]